MAVAVMREGSEVVLFMTGIVMQGKDTGFELLIGSGIGLLLGAVLSMVLYFGLAAIPIRQMFAVTGILITLLAAGLAASAVKQLSNAGLLNAFDSTVWDSSSILSEDSWPGRVLSILVGYMDRPTGMQLIAYVATAAAIFFELHLASADKAGQSERIEKGAPRGAFFFHRLKDQDPTIPDDRQGGARAASGISSRSLKCAGR
ncbi:FTR1 family protein [Bradyrhizobium sp. RDI18]|uniref:FTR1 family iron permease n=1 Tax=Bradyrhizobium sp. RDI18 TaxID=3367400 RepID=UPI0037171960